MRPWSWKQTHTKLMDMSVMTIREGPSQEPRPSIKYHRRGLPTPVLLNFSRATMAKGTKMTNTGNMAARSGFVFGSVWSKCYCSSATKGVNSRANHVICDLNGRNRWNIVWNISIKSPRRRGAEGGGQSWKTWVFIYNMHPIILCHSSTFAFFRNHRGRDTRRRFHFWPLCYTNP